MSYTLEELEKIALKVEERGSSTTYLNGVKVCERHYPPFDVDDDSDICALMARNDEQVLNEWRNGTTDVEGRKIVLVTDDETGRTEYMQQLSNNRYVPISKDGHLGGVVD